MDDHMTLLHDHFLFQGAEELLHEAQSLGVSRVSRGDTICDPATAGRALGIVLEGRTEAVAPTREKAALAVNGPGRPPGAAAHATIGLPDDRLGERICTFIVQTGDVTPTLDSIAEYLDSIGVAKRLRPEHIEFIDAIPMTESVKVKRHQLADELERRLKERAE